MNRRQLLVAGLVGLAATVQPVVAQPLNRQSYEWAWRTFVAENAGNDEVREIGVSIIMYGDEDAASDRFWEFMMDPDEQVGSQYRWNTSLPAQNIPVIGDLSTAFTVGSPNYPDEAAYYVVVQKGRFIVQTVVWAKTWSSWFDADPMIAENIDWIRDDDRLTHRHLLGFLPTLQRVQEINPDLVEFSMGSE